jgi:hypothetical protein
MALDMGKPNGQGRAEIEKCAGVREYYAREAPLFLAPEPVQTEAISSFVAFEALGTSLTISLADLI